MIDAPGVNEFIDLSDAPHSYSGQTGKVVKVNATETAVEFGTGGSGGATAFTQLSDVPNSYTGAALKVVRVNAGQTGLEFATVSGTGDVVGPASATDNALARFDTTTGKLIQNGIVTESDTGDLQAVNSIVFGQTPTGITTQGQMFWDANEQTVSINVDQTNGVKLSLGTEQYVRIVNKTGVQINDGQVVYINSAQGNRPTATLAQANSFTTTKVIGVATQNIANNAEGFVTTFGEVHGYNTSGFTAGDILYLSPTTSGALQNTVPSSPNYNVVVATALNSTINGNIFVHPEAPIDLDNTLGDNSDLVVASEKAVKTYVDTGLGTKVTGNVAITGATKTKITYDTKGLVTSGADATTADIADSLNKRYVTDANLTVIGNTSGTNTGDNATNTQYSGLATSKQDTLVSGTNIKTVNSTSLLGSGDIVVQPTLVSGTNIKTVNGNTLLGSGDVTISGGAITTQDEGSTLSTTVNTLNFTGAGVTASGSGTTTTINIPGGSGSTVSGQATVNFGTVTQEDAYATVTVNTASALSTSIISVTPSGVATTDHDPDDYQWDNISGYVSNIVNGVSFDIIGVAPNGTWGTYKLNYTIN